MNSSTPIYKIVVLGQGRVGKTSMTFKYTKNQFHDDQESSINACYLEKDLKLPNHNKIVKLAIWDTAGQEIYNAVAPIYYRDAVGAVIVYQIVSIESFEKVKKWVDELRQHANNKDIVIIIAGNKADMQTQRRVSKNDAQKYAKSKQIKHYLVSAKNGMNINELFSDLAEQIYQVRQKNGVKMGDGRRNLRVKIQDKGPKQGQKAKKDCC